MSHNIAILIGRLLFIFKIEIIVTFDIYWEQSLLSAWETKGGTANNTSRNKICVARTQRKIPIGQNACQ
jgi:hypothetical protein